jgi:hypothetical protein
MTDLAHTFGNDLALAANGDLAVSTGTQAGQERVLRRLMTNPGGYLWSLPYGGGLPAMVGQPGLPKRIAALARAQMLQESAVARTPAPLVTARSDNNGTVSLYIRYADANTGDTATLSVPVI